MRIVEPKDMKYIIRADGDDVQGQIQYDRSSWLQWLFSVCENPTVGIFADVDGEKTLAYAVCILAKVPPVSNAIQIIYFYQREGVEPNMVLKEIAAWGRLVGVPRIEMMTNDYENVGRYGFKLKCHVVSMEV